MFPDLQQSRYTFVSSKEKRKFRNAARKMQRTSNRTYHLFGSEPSVSLYLKNINTEMRFSLSHCLYPFDRWMNSN